jgi:predicted cupin superfamily sugar epimerase
MFFKFKLNSAMQFTVTGLVERFGLLPHPEGGFYKETYRSEEIIKNDALPGRFPGDRNFSTAIYFLLEQGNFSAFHRIKSDECWHFYAGQSLHVHVIHPNGKYELIRLGNDIAAGETFQAVVPAACWFASETADGGRFSFVGCTVAPGFDFSDFELADGKDLSAEFPQFEKLIARLCR